ncbi:cytochrome c biogenesis protein ResB [Thermosipho ferrireducens]|uniref:Cytochrome c biogenesis protein ResB n=1 Tax=Thermosipho ferrireducens TaxID=2571116 RepID=A0ABX7S637_9BACT|nr:cytochrome c biogenesis protein ResB [Thermosipho ferrireducens]QTA38037.1 cytochrome c biogenesis protein ResB [Thermosipho ferrireducens]
MKKVIELFKSLKFALVLMISISIFAALGTFIPQYHVSEYYISKYGITGYIILFLQLDHYSNSIIFGFLLTLFFLNTLVCTFVRIVKVYPSLFRKRFKSDSVEEFEGSMKELKIKLKEQGFKAKIKGNEMYGSKALLGKIGPDIIHVGILIAIVSGLVIGLTTKMEKFYLSPGDEFNVDGKVLELADFKFYTYENGMPKDWISIVRYDGKTYSIEVNKPMNIQKGKLYQWSHKVDWNVKLRFEGLDYVYEGPDDSSFKAGNYRIKISRFIPHLRVSNGKVYNMSNEPVNPAILVEYYNLLGVRIGRQWVFENFDYPTDPKDFPVKAYLAGYKKYEQTGLLYVKSQGDLLMFIALIFIGIGSMLSIRRDYNKVYAVRDKDKIRVYFYQKEKL